jgi:hypothetical protein
MILDKGPRALICAGVFCLAATLGGGGQAAEVYPGCAQPGPPGKVWWVDPVNGKAPAEGGLGTQAAPWSSLTGIIGGQWATGGFTLSGYARPLLSSVVYLHPVPGKGVLIVADRLGDPPVNPGDTIKLMNGAYGDIVIGAFAREVVNPDFVTVEAAPGQTPVLSTLYIRSTNKWVFNGVKVQSLWGTNNNKLALVTIGDQGAALPTSDIIFENMQLSTADRLDGWTKAQWVAQARGGLREVGSPGDGKNGEPYTTCISITRSHIHNVRIGAVLAGNNTLFSLNEMDHFGDDGIDYAASNLAITRNNIHDNLDIGDGNHEDAMQGQNGSVPRGVAYNAFSNVLIDSNLVIRQTDPKLAFPTYLQGIDAFDEDWTNLTVTNNAVVTSACWGIGFASVHGGKVINNTVVDDGSDTGTKNPVGRIMCRPVIQVGDKTHQGLRSNDVVIRNNLAPKLGIDNRNPNMMIDHNICLNINGGCQILTFVNGKINFGVYRPGEYANHNIIGRHSASETFVTFDPAKSAFDLRLRPIASAIGAGSSIDAPAVDLTGAPRGPRVDAGAYQYAPGK